MNKIDAKGDTSRFSQSDAGSALIGILSGAGSGVLLGVLIASTVVPVWSLTAAIVIFHVTMAMIAMGAWVVPSLLSDPEKEEGGLHYKAALLGDSQMVQKEPDGDMVRRISEKATTTTL